MNKPDTHLHLFRFANIGLFVGYWIFMIASYPELPEEIPMHFGSGGSATWYADTSMITWFMVPAFITVIFALLLGFSRLSKSMPLHSVWLNYPFKKEVLELDKPTQYEFAKKIYHYIDISFQVLIMWVLILFIYTGIFKYKYITGDWNLPLLPVVIGLILLLAGHVYWLSVQLKKDIRERLNQIKAS